MTADEAEQTGKARAEIIQQAQQRVAEARRQAVNYLHQRGPDAAETAAAQQQMQVAVIDYYYSLHPLRNEPVVEEYWETAELWTEKQPVPTSDGRMRWEEETVTGLDAVAEYATTVEREERVVEGFRGTRTEVEASTYQLPLEHLITASLRLDEAADRLGFSPPTDEESREVVLDESAQSEAGDNV